MSERIEQISAQLEEITPGPWEWGHHWDSVDWIKNGSGGRKFRPASDTSYKWIPSCADAKFIASAPETVAYLLQLARKQGLAIERVCDVVSNSAAFGTGIEASDILQAIRASLESA